MTSNIAMRLFGKRVLGAVAILFGTAILAWVAYNLLARTGEIEISLLFFVRLVLPIAMIIVGRNWLLDRGPGLESQKIDFEAPELVRSVERARARLDYFIGRVNANYDGAYIKFPFETDGGCTEHLWGYVHNYRDGVFSVSVANDPHSQAADYDKRRDVPESIIEDWQIMRQDGKLEGAYSLIGAFEYLERTKMRLNRTLRNQRAALLDAPNDHV